MRFTSWNRDLAHVLPELQRVALGDRRLRVVTMGGRIAFGLPDDPELAAGVLGLYRPMKAKAKLMTLMYHIALKTGALSFLKNRMGEGAAQIPWLNDEHNLGFLGCNPSHGLRCILLSKEKDGRMKVTKLAIGEDLKPVITEGESLERLAKKFSGVPGILERDRGKDWAAFSTRHLPGQGPGSLTDFPVLDLLEGWLRPERIRINELNWLEPVLGRLPEVVGVKLEKLVVRQALNHGDFTLWNLRCDGEKLVAIDWEWGCEDGVGGLDLIHGLIMEGKLVEGLAGKELIEAIEKRAKITRVEKYLTACGWSELNLWMALGFGCAAEKTGIDVELELDVLKNRLELAPQN
ncbi:MAG: hypothetical protein ACON5N_02795 [Akkermansiaceae bacterium]